MMVTFSHEWDSSLNPKDAWDNIVLAFEDSRRSKVWPNELAEVQASAETLEENSHVEVRYKVGAHQTKVHYKISRLIPYSLLRYEAQKDHPLFGGAEILLFVLPHGTHLIWRGSYRSKSIFSWLSLFWFKLFYERRFFGRFIESFQRLEPSQEGAA